MGLLKLPPQAYLPEEGSAAQGFTFGDLPGFCSLGLALPVAFLLLELCLLLSIWPDADTKASEEDTGV